MIIEYKELENTQLLLIHHFQVMPVHYGQSQETIFIRPHLPNFKSVATIYQLLLKLIILFRKFLLLYLAVKVLIYGHVEIFQLVLILIMEYLQEHQQQ
jgi:hypothetical protein